MPVVALAFLLLILGQGGLSAQPRPAEWRPYFTCGPCQGAGSVRFQHLPVALADIDSFVPVGNMVADHVLPTNHAYIEFKGGLVYPPPFGVVAPAAGTVVRVERLRYQPQPGGPRVTPGDYALYIEHSCTFYSYFIHLNELAPGLRRKIDRELAEDERATCLRIPVESGEALGLAGSYRAIDFGVVDRERENPFVNRARYAGTYVHTLSMQSPFDYYDEPLKSAFAAKSPRRIEPRGGRNFYDIDGRLVGNWVLRGSGDYDGRDAPGRPYYFNHLAFAYDKVEPRWIVASLSAAFPAPGQYGVRGNNPDPAAIDAASGIVRYELVRNFNRNAPGAYDTNALPVAGTLLVRLIDARTIEVEQFPGKRSSDIAGFTPAALRFER